MAVCRHYKAVRRELIEFSAAVTGTPYTDYIGTTTKRQSHKADHRARVERRRNGRHQKSDIQDAMRRRRIDEIRALRGSDIQDTMRRQIDGVLGLLTPPGCADIQDAIAPAGAFG